MADNYNINVDVETLKAAVSKMQEAVDSIDQSIKDAAAAADKAVEGFGGTTTLVGGKLESMIKKVDDDTFTGIQTTVNSMMTRLNNVGDEYTEQESNLLDALKLIEEEQGGNQ